MIDVVDVKVGDMLRITDRLVVDGKKHVIRDMIKDAGKSYKVREIGAPFHTSDEWYIFLEDELGLANYWWHPSLLDYECNEDILIEPVTIDDLFTGFDIIK